MAGRSQEEHLRWHLVFCQAVRLNTCQSAPPALPLLLKPHVLQEARSQLEERIQGPGSLQESSLSSILRHTHSCHEHCLRIWFGTLALAAAAWGLRPGPWVPRQLADMCAICLSRHAPGVRGWRKISAEDPSCMYPPRRFTKAF